jgi:dienelactone hydrolase
MAAETVDRNGVAATWHAATVALPGAATGGLPIFGRWRDSAVQHAVRNIAADRRVPAIVFLHGCDGIGIEEESARIAYMEAGFAVFFPDSFARIGRRSNCRADTYATGAQPEAHAYRLDEIAYAREQLRTLPWIDQSRVYAIGFSEGGMALAGYAGHDFARIVITGWHCDGNGRYRGLRTPKDVPVLAIVGGDDPWYLAKKDRHCGQFFGDRANSRSLVLADNGHAILNSENLENAGRAKRAILDFLGAQ